MVEWINGWVDGSMVGKMGGWISGWEDGWLDQWLGGWMDGSMVGLMDERMDERTDGWMTGTKEGSVRANNIPLMSPVHECRAVQVCNLRCWVGRLLTQEHLTRLKLLPQNLLLLGRNAISVFLALEKQNKTKLENPRTSLETSGGGTFCNIWVWWGRGGGMVGGGMTHPPRVVGFPSGEHSLS